MLDKPNVFNIPANYHFFESLFDLAEKKFGPQLSQVKFFLPNRRSCREFREIFLAKKNTILPQIKAISDISYEDFFDFLPNQNAKDEIDELLQINALQGLDYLFFLSKEIQKQSVFGEDLDFEQAFKIALNLQNLFDDIEREEIDLSKLSEIDDSNLSQHRLLTLDFLKNFHVKIKNSLIKENIFFASASQNLIIQKFVSLLETQGSKAPIVIAGSTGSVSFSAKLIRAISQKNYVVLHGATGENFSEENHPQFFLNRLIQFLKIDKKAIAQIAEEKFCLSPNTRQNLISLMMLPSVETLKWQEIFKHLDLEKTAQDLTKNFRLIEAKNEIEEAKIIKLILHEALQNNKSTALITNNDKLASLVKLELAQGNLPFNDTRNLSIFNSPLVNFLLLILELIESDFNSHSLLAILKNPLCSYSKNKEILADFEIKILRQDRANSGLEGITKKLENDNSLKEFFNNFCADFSKFTTNTLASHTISLIETAEKLSKKTWSQLLEQEPAQIELFEFFEKLKTQEIALNKKNLLRLFKTLLSQISYFEKSDAAAPIQILSTIEARLLNYDLVVIASLNEGDFPQIESENWLGKKIKKDLEIDRTLKKLGQSAYDFCNYLSNESVILTRCKSSNGAVLIESPFLLKLKTICQKIGVGLNCGEKYFAQLAKQNCVQSRKIEATNPKPKIEFRPKKISITEISKLLSNPYDIYAKKILQLEALEEIDFEPSYAEFGSFIHEALEEFVKNPKDKNFTKKAEEIFEKYFLFAEAKLIWWPKFENIFDDFLKENERFLNLKNRVEIAAQLDVLGVTIRGKIDRAITNNEGETEIFDYKTGQVPSKIDVIRGANPQLTIAALMLADEKISALNYWKLSASSTSEIKKICDKSEEILILTAAAKAGLTKLLEFFANEESGYLATDNSTYSDYQNLARIEESNK
ncbi:MAG: PD-(D/E)XK nuclease family protein [Rickettsiales bacterium]|nr:PD-(D/E)XK nuclease family protein [Rickettsiales bacterium]